MPCCPGKGRQALGLMSEVFCGAHKSNSVPSFLILGISVLTSYLQTECANDQAGGAADSGCTEATPLCRAAFGQFGVTCESELHGQPPHLVDGCMRTLYLPTYTAAVTAAVAAAAALTGSLRLGHSSSLIGTPLRIHELYAPKWLQHNLSCMCTSFT